MEKPENDNAPQRQSGMVICSDAPIAQRAAFDIVRYASCWEDPALLTGAVPGPGVSWLSIASGGDNAFALLATNPARVVAFDLSEAQLALCQLKRAAFLSLDYAEWLGFLGLAPMSPREREALFRDHVRRELDDATARRYASDSVARRALRRGAATQGKFERYFRIFARFVVPLIHSPAIVRAVFEPRDRAARERFYDDVWDNRRYRLLFRLFFSRTAMGRLGRDPAFFRYVRPGDITGEIRARARRALVELPTEDNPWLRYVLTGSFGPALPPYARPEAFEAIRANLGALEFFRGSTADAARAFGSAAFDAFNLSDIFEYMDESGFRAAAHDLVALARPGARLCYWNMMVPRDLSEIAPADFIPLRDEAAPLFACDRAFFYGAFHLDCKSSNVGDEARNVTKELKLDSGDIFTIHLKCHENHIFSFGDISSCVMPHAQSRMPFNNRRADAWPFSDAKTNWNNCRRCGANGSRRS